MKEIEAFVFDVFGTVVDWESTVTAVLELLGHKHNILQGKRIPRSRCRE
jgi:hypothetical protein